eukprot:9806753-Prorocentrum_lima.AAC.1
MVGDSLNLFLSEVFCHADLVQMVGWRMRHLLHLILGVVNADVEYLNQVLIEVSCHVDLVPMQIAQ